MYLTKISYYSIFSSIGSVFCSRPEDIELPDDDSDATMNNESDVIFSNLAM